VGELLAITATQFVKALLQGRQETRFLVVLLSGKVESETDGNAEERIVESKPGEDHENTHQDKHQSLRVDTTDHATDE